MLVLWSCRWTFIHFCYLLMQELTSHDNEVTYTWLEQLLGDMHTIEDIQITMITPPHNVHRATQNNRKTRTPQEGGSANSLAIYWNINLYSWQWILYKCEQHTLLTSLHSHRTCLSSRKIHTKKLIYILCLIDHTDFDVLQGWPSCMCSPIPVPLWA
jgi:hypothetical protein